MNPTRHLLLTAPLILCSAAVLAEAQTFNIDIPAQPLPSALESLAQQTGIKPFYSDSLVAGKTVRAVSGRLTAEQALARLLSGSGLSHRFNGDKAVAITAGAETDAKTLPPVKVSGQAEYDSTDPYNKSYTVTNSSTATKTDTPLIETPVSVQIVPRAVMDDQKSTRIKDALENVSGVRARPTLGLGTNFIIRGFQNGRVYRNGLLFGNDGFPGEFDAGNLQSIEVLKGPAAVLYGRIEPGGLINVTTKKPLDIPYYSLEQQFGSYDSYRTQWDATGAITDDKSLLYRFTGAYQNNESFRDFIFTDRVLVNPSVTWRPTDRTDITLSVEHSDQDYQADVGVPAIGTRPAAIPISRSLDDPNSPIDNSTHTLVSTEINHHFNDEWAIHNRFLAGLTDTYSAFITRSPTVNGPGEDGLGADGILRRNIFGQTTEGESFATNLDLTGKFRLGFSNHDVLAGFDYYHAMNTYVTSGEYILPNPALDIDIFNPAPSYGIDPALIQSTLSRNMAYSFFRTDWYGAYFQDHITLWDKLHILGGGRYDWSTTGRGRGASSGAAEADLPSNTDEGFSPRVGILYQPWKQLGIYGNWTTSFSANNAPAANGTTFDPQTGEQFEAGVKTQLFDDRLIATLAYYHLTKDNILVNDQSTPDLFDKIANKQRSQGIELDVTGQITDRLSLIGSYAYTDAKVIEDHVGSTAGNRMPNVPDHSGSLFVKYDMNGYEAQEGFSFGVGGVAAGQRQTDFDNTSQLPGFIRVDAFAAYRMKVGPTRVTTQFNIRNLLDKTYYESTDPNANAARPYLSIAPGAPLTAVGSIRVEY
jgi:iron complex outermembrane receptor protein